MTEGNFGWDYPPGVKESDIPGCRPEDERYERLWDEVTSMKDTEVLRHLERYPDAYAKAVETIEEILIDCLMNDSEA